MKSEKVQKILESACLPSRFLAEQAFSRTAGAPLVQGNRVRLLKDATENYPAWIDALQSAERFIHFESYIIYGDDVGRRFAKILAAKAKEGVKVRVLYDWVGGRSLAERTARSLTTSITPVLHDAILPRHVLRLLDRDGVYHYPMKTIDGPIVLMR